ncbi:DEAD/DEAH box helicase [Aeoliella mucimassa]|uniref:Type III restriction enzyme, res subunit n=1 Tax=Aeoliella mucimassa TaxID=2527972 RepID=A0A518AMN5_9BACT|nr:DEAD/DEAH box helicase family protein [Aeoliella mucimassa]QDU55951.1 Type III restriction enzyme, res subunit [Aeoliella mucimassa]
MRLPLKEFQIESLEALKQYARSVRDYKLTGSRVPERDAFEETTAGRSYYQTPKFAGVPYVCLRLPTGGGKTLLAAHAVGVVGRHLLETDQPACLWITPSTTIRDQTLRALKNPSHPYRVALEEALGPAVEVSTIEEVLLSPRLVKASAPLVVVTTIQSYRVQDDKGRELAAARRIYRDNGYMQAALADLPTWVRDELSADASGLVDLSLANALRLRRPIVIMDEAHNARTPTSFDSLARFGPSFVLELTATPEHAHDPQHPSSPTFASNVLHAVSALELKNEGMIKLPVDLESRGDWLEVLAATHQRREELEVVADRAHHDSGLPFYRPIALIQAQPNSKTKETHTVEVVKEALVEKLGVPEEYVRICTGKIDELGDENLMATNCQVRYVITVDKLREGWDCPLAYVLGSIGNTATATAVEQLIGRILRMPNATPTRVPALDRSYAFVLSDSVAETAGQLRDQMVRTCGFDERSATEAFRVVAQGQRRIGFGSIPLAKAPDPEVMPSTLAAKVSYDQAKQELVLNDLPSAGEVRLLREAVASESDKQAVDAFWESERPVGVAAKPLTEYAKPLQVPRLTVLQGERRTLLEPIELDQFEWDLDTCNPVLTETEFASELRVGSAATIDVEPAENADDGGLVTRMAGDVRLRQLELIGEGEDWTDVEIARWLDRELHRGDSLQGLPHSQSQPWLAKIVDGLIDARGLQRGMVVRRRHELAKVLRVKVADHGRQQIRKATDQLFQTMPEAVLTSDEHAVWIEEQEFKPARLDDSAVRFNKHAFDQIGEMNDEERLCAQHIDAHDNVERWIRNPEREPQGGFWLPKSPGKFFPDFIVELKDGRIVIVEYKMGKMSNDPEELHKKSVGVLWAARSEGRCGFAWVVAKNWTSLLDSLQAN